MIATGTCRACSECNQTKAILDTFVRDLTAVNARSQYHPVAASNWRGPVARSLNRHQSPLTKHISGAKRSETELVTEAGLVLQPVVAMVLKTTDLEKWLYFVVQGLTYRHFGELLPPTTPYLVRQVDAAGVRNIAKGFGETGGFQGPYRQGDNICEWGYVAAAKDHAIWLITLYGRLFCWVAALPEPELRKLE